MGHAAHGGFIRGYAGGGRVFKVGEQGRELLTLPAMSAPAYVTPNSTLNGSANGGAGPDLGTITVVVQSDTGEDLIRKIVTVGRRTNRTTFRHASAGQDVAVSAWENYYLEYSPYPLAGSVIAEHRTRTSNHRVSGAVDRAEWRDSRRDYSAAARGIVVATDHPRWGYGGTAGPERRDRGDPAQELHLRGLASYYVQCHPQCRDLLVRRSSRLHLGQHDQHRAGRWYVDAVRAGRVSRTGQRRFRPDGHQRPWHPCGHQPLARRRVHHHRAGERPSGAGPTSHPACAVPSASPWAPPTSVPPPAPPDRPPYPRRWRTSTTPSPSATLPPPWRWAGNRAAGSAATRSSGIAASTGSPATCNRRRPTTGPRRSTSSSPSPPWTGWVVSAPPHVRVDRRRTRLYNAGNALRLYYPLGDMPGGPYRPLVGAATFPPLTETMVTAAGGDQSQNSYRAASAAIGGDDLPVASFAPQYQAGTRLCGHRGNRADCHIRRRDRHHRNQHRRVLLGQPLRDLRRRAVAAGADRLRHRPRRRLHPAASHRRQRDAAAGVEGVVHRRPQSAAWSAQAYSVGAANVPTLLACRINLLATPCSCSSTGFRSRRR
jgi:hypothetical protein